jgi:hypothetical protein
LIKKEGGKAVAMRESQQDRKQVNEYAQKNMRFNRFLIFRYMTAIFFFINLYWVLLNLVHWTVFGLVPVVLLLVDGMIIFEQTKKYWQPSNRLKLTKIGYWIQAGVNVLGIILVLVGWQEKLFSFFNQSGKPILVTCLILGLLACLYMERKVWLIENDRDSYLNYLNVFEKGGKTNELGKR